MALAEPGKRLYSSPTKLEEWCLGKPGLPSSHLTSVHCLLLCLPQLWKIVCLYCSGWCRSFDKEMIAQLCLWKNLENPWSCFYIKIYLNFLGRRKEASNSRLCANRVGGEVIMGVVGIIGKCWPLTTRPVFVHKLLYSHFVGASFHAWKGRWFDSSQEHT